MLVAYFRGVRTKSCLQERKHTFNAAKERTLNVVKMAYTFEDCIYKLATVAKDTSYSEQNVLLVYLILHSPTVLNRKLQCCNSTV